MATFWNSSLIFLVSLAGCLAATLCTTAEIAAENVGKLATANNILAQDVYHQLSSKSSENIFFSPFSLSTAFGMLYYGTRGNTAKELRNTLGYERADLPEELVSQTFQGYLKESLPSQDPSAYVLNAANSILLDKRMDFYASYIREVQDLYQASVEAVDFVKDNQQVVNDVNSWVNDKTNGKIDKLLDELDPATSLIILNAVYFKGTWKTQFEPSKTMPQTFYNNGLQSSAKNVPMMKLTEELPYFATNYAQIVELPYKGGNISMLILLPNERDGLESLENGLTHEKISAIRKQLFKAEVHLSLPKFKVQYSKEMSGAFESLGARSIFTHGADFSGMTSSKGLFVSQVVHKAVVEVNEAGSEAAAATGVVTNGFEPDVTVDHPFLFGIVDNRNDMLLFAGRVTNL